MTKEGRVALLELVSVLLIIGSIVSIAVPKSAELKRRQAAAHLLADIQVIRTAVYGFYSDSAYFPAESPTESFPENLRNYLPLTFLIEPRYGAIKYRNWPVAAAYRDSSSANIVGLTVTPRDPRVGASAAAQAPRLPKFLVGNTLTVIFFGS
jgi:type II secretory pathway pseudopilin PulG